MLSIFSGLFYLSLVISLIIVIAIIIIFPVHRQANWGLKMLNKFYPRSRD